MDCTCKSCSTTGIHKEQEEEKVEVPIQVSIEQLEAEKDLDIILKEKKKLENENRLDILRYIADIWKQNIGKNWIPTQNSSHHRCEVSPNDLSRNYLDDINMIENGLGEYKVVNWNKSHHHVYNFGEIPDGGSNESNLSGTKRKHDSISTGDSNSNNSNNSNNNEVIEKSNTTLSLSTNGDRNNMAVTYKGKAPVALADELEFKYCNITNVKARIYQSRNRGNNRHICIADYCDSENTDPDLHFRLMEEINDVYVCEKYAIPHFCGDHCDGSYREINKDGMYVCRISGRYFDEMHTVDKFWTKEQKNIDKDMANNPFVKVKKDMKYEDFKDIDTVINRCVNRSENSSLDIKRKSSHSNKEHFLKLAIERVSKLFPNVDMTSIYKKRDKQIESEIIATFIKYVNKSNSSGVIPNTCTLFSLFMTFAKKFPNRVDLTGISPVQKRMLILFYSHQCLSLWVIVRTKTEHGMKSPSDFPWPEFVDSALSLLESGFYVTSNDGQGEKIILIEKDYFLSILPENPYANTANHSTNGSGRNSAPGGGGSEGVGYSNSAATGSNSTGSGSTGGSSKKSESRDGGSKLGNRNGGKRKKKPKKNSLTKIKNSICSALIHAIMIEGVPPQELQIGNVDINNVDDSIFTRNRNSNSGSGSNANPDIKKEIKTEIKNEMIGNGNSNSNSNTESPARYFF